MCRHITREQQLEGWRALAGLVSGIGPICGGVLAALMLRLGRKAVPGQGTPNAIP